MARTPRSRKTKKKPVDEPPKRSAKDIELDRIRQDRRRIAAADAVFHQWETDYRVADCYQYWRGNQRAEPFDRQDDRRAIINLVHPQVRAQLPSLYFYRPFARAVLAPEKSDTPATKTGEKARLLQNTGNTLARDKQTQFRPSTFLALKESFWAMGIVEVGYSADVEPLELSAEDKPPVKETEDTTVDPGVREPVSKPVTDEDGLPLQQEPRTLTPEDEAKLDEEIAKLRSRVKSERFYVKHIPAKTFLVSASDKPIVTDNDWVGYWADYDVEDVKRARGYTNTEDLKPSVPKNTGEEVEDDAQLGKEVGEGDDGPPKHNKVRLYKIWDLRTNTKKVLAHNHDRYLFRKPFKRLGLKFYRPDIDPNHFRPIPPIYNGLGEQDEHNDSYEALRIERKTRRAKWTYDPNQIDKSEVAKFESGEASIVPRKPGSTPNPVNAVEHPSYAALPLQTFSLSERAFAQATGVPAESRQADQQGEKTATQAVIQNTAKQVADSFDRAGVAEWLAEIIEELVMLAIDRMVLPRWIQMHVSPESPVAIQEMMHVASTWKEIKTEELQAAATGVRWHFEVDVESISPVAQQERLQRLLQTLNFIGNPNQAVLLSKAPMLLDVLLSLSLAGPMETVDRAAVIEGLQAVVELSQATAAQGAGQPRGVSPMPDTPPPSPSAQPPAPAPESPPSPPPPGIPAAQQG